MFPICAIMPSFVKYDCCGEWVFEETLQMSHTLVWPQYRNLQHFPPFAEGLVFSGAWIPPVFLLRGFEEHEYGYDKDEPDDEGSLVFPQISANRI